MHGDNFTPGKLTGSYQNMSMSLTPGKGKLTILQDKINSIPQRAPSDGGHVLQFLADKE